VPLMVTFAVPMVIRSQYAGIDSVLKMSGQGRITAMFSLLSAALLIGLTLLLNEHFGVFSSIAAMTLSACLLNPLMTISACDSGIPLRWRANAARGVFAAICMLLLHRLLPGPSLSAAVVGCALLLWGAGIAFRR
jgi:O-antigen/teichoic acid export membrane protein